MSFEESYDHLVKILMIGESGVGKTSLIHKFFNADSSIHHLSTIAIDFKLKTISVEGSRMKLQIWDTAGQERFKGMTTSFFRGSDGIVVCYSVNDENSFQRVNDWMSQIKSFAPGDVSVILVGNKSDLEDCRQVSFQQGAELASSFKIPFFEASAKSGLNANKIFESMASSILVKLRDGNSGDKPADHIDQLTRRQKITKKCC